MSWYRAVLAQKNCASAAAPQMYEHALNHLVLSAEGKGGRMIWHALSFGGPQNLQDWVFCIRDTRLNSIGWCSQPVTWSGSIIPNLYDKEANCENNRQQFLDWCTRFSPARPGNMVSYMSTDPILKFVPKIFSARWQWNFTNFGSRWHLSLRFYPEIWKKHIFS